VDARADVDRREKAQFALRIAFCNSFAYLEAVLIPSYIDPQLTSHVIWGARTYRWGYYTAVLAPVIFLVTFRALRHANARGWRCFWSCSPLLAGELCALPFFGPEFPHGGIVTWPTVAALSSLIATWLRYSSTSLTYLSDPQVPLEAKIEGIKSALSAWQAVAIATCVGFFAILVPWAVAIQGNNRLMVTSPEDQVRLNSFTTLAMGTIAAIFLLGPIREVIAKVLMVADQFAAVRAVQTDGTLGDAHICPSDSAGGGGPQIADRGA
jgi:hypothetical protein